MLPVAETLFNELTAKLNEYEPERENLIRAEKAVMLITAYLTRLKDLIKQEGFQSEQEEIYFYKHVKPKFHALYIYYATVFNIESDRPMGSKKVRRRYFHNELRRIDNYFYHNLELYKYYRSGKTHLDKEFFTRGQAFKENMIDIVTPIIDREFCTLYSVKIAILIAFEQVKEYLQNSMLEIATPASPSFPIQTEPVTWTDSKTGLIELAYALQAAGSLNNGKATLKQTMDFLQSAFHIELGNASRTFQTILTRKKGDTAFLDRLKKALLKRIEDEFD